MYILQNALKNLMRNKGRNILFGIIMVAILSCTAVSIIINSTSDKLIEDYKTKFGSEVFIQTDQKKLNELMSSGKYNPSAERIPNEIYEKLAQSEYVKNAIMSSYFRGLSTEIEAIDQKESQIYSGGGGSGVITTGPNGGQSSGMNLPNLNILGGLTPEGIKEFENGTRKIVDGKFVENEGEAIISEDFAKINNLKVGDILNIKNYTNNDKSAELNLTVSGIYFDDAKSEDMGIKHPMLNRKNEIITTFNTLKAYDKTVQGAGVAIEAKYYLKNPDLVTAFNDEAHKIGLNELYNISVDSQSYNNIVKPVEGLKGIANVFMTIVLIFGGSVLILISVLGTRERKYEIGVLRAMGMKKAKVALGLVFETLTMIVICLVIGLSVGSAVAQPTSDMLLQNQLEATENNNGPGFVGDIGATEVDKLENLDVFLSGDAILTIAFIALILGAISVSIGILYINRYEPRKILSERN